MDINWGCERGSIKYFVVMVRNGYTFPLAMQNQNAEQKFPGVHLRPLYMFIIGIALIHNLLSEKWKITEKHEG